MVAKVSETFRSLIIYIKTYVSGVHLLVHYVSVIYSVGSSTHTHFSMPATYNDSKDCSEVTRTFCEWFLTKCTDNPAFFYFILLISVAGFSRH